MPSPVQFVPASSTADTSGVTLTPEGAPKPNAVPHCLPTCTMQDYSAPGGLRANVVVHDGNCLNAAAMNVTTTGTAHVIQWTEATQW